MPISPVRLDATAVDVSVTWWGPRGNSGESGALSAVGTEFTGRRSMRMSRLRASSARLEGQMSAGPKIRHDGWRLAGL